MTGWWFSHPFEKYDFVNWDYDIPNISGKIKNGIQTTNQMIFHEGGHVLDLPCIWRCCSVDILSDGLKNHVPKLQKITLTNWDGKYVKQPFNPGTPLAEDWHSELQNLSSHSYTTLELQSKRFNQCLKKIICAWT